MLTQYLFNSLITTNSRSGTTVRGVRGEQPTDRDRQRVVLRLRASTKSLQFHRATSLRARH